MAADNYAPPGSGITFRSLADGASVQWPAGVTAFATTVSPGANALQVVDAAHGLPVQVADGADLTLGAKGDAAATNPANAASAIALLKGILTELLALASNTPVTVSNFPATQPVSGQVGCSPETSTIFSGSTALTPSFAPISAAAQGDNLLVAAIPSKRIRVLALFVMAASQVGVRLRDNAAPPNNLIGDDVNSAAIPANGGFVLPFNPAGWCQTAVGQALELCLTGSVGCAGCVLYVAV